MLSQLLSVQLISDTLGSMTANKDANMMWVISFELTLATRDVFHMHTCTLAAYVLYNLLKGAINSPCFIEPVYTVQG